MIVEHARVFPDSAGKLGLVISGSAVDSVPKIARWDKNGQTVWQADVAHDVIGLCLIEPPGGRRLFAATTKAGDVLVFDEHGTLEHQGDLGSAMKRFRKRDGSVSATVYGMKSGELGDSTVFMCPECGNYRLAGTTLTLLQNGTLQRPDRVWFRDLVNRKRGDADEYPIITQYDLG